MKSKLLIAASAACFAFAPFAEEALAQKSADTVRVAMNFPIKRLSGYYQPDPEAGMFFRLM